MHRTSFTLMELGLLPVRQEIDLSKLNFLHHILKLPSDDPVLRVVMNRNFTRVNLTGKNKGMRSVGPPMSWVGKNESGNHLTFSVTHPNLVSRGRPNPEIHGGNLLPLPRTQQNRDTV